MASDKRIAWPMLMNAATGDIQYGADIETVIKRIKEVPPRITLCVYYNLPGADVELASTPDINISVASGRMTGRIGLGPCSTPWRAHLPHEEHVLDGGDVIYTNYHVGCEGRYHHGTRWLMNRGIVSVVQEKGEAEPFLRYLDSLWD